MTRVAASASILSVILVAGGLHASPAPPPEQAAPTFTRDVAPILYKNCTSCHRAGEIAPMPLVSTRTCGRGPSRSNRKSLARDAAVGRRSAARQVQGRPQPERRGHRHDRSLGRTPARRRATDSDCRRCRRFRRRLARRHSPTRSSRCRTTFADSRRRRSRRHRFLHADAVQGRRLREGAGREAEHPGVVHHAGVYVDRKTARRRAFRERPHHRRRRQADDAQSGRPRERRVGDEENSEAAVVRAGPRLRGVSGRRRPAASGPAPTSTSTCTTRRAESRRRSDGDRPVFRQAGKTVTHQIYHSFGVGRPDHLHGAGRRGDRRRAAPRRTVAKAVSICRRFRHTPTTGRSSACTPYGAGHALRPHAAPPLPRQEHEVHADAAGRLRRDPVERAEVRLQLAVLLRARDAAQICPPAAR